MTMIIIKVILGLFVWMVLPGLIYKKRKSRNKMLWNFVHIVCKIIGAAIIVYAGIDLIRLLLTFK